LQVHNQALPNIQTGSEGSGNVSGGRDPEKKDRQERHRPLVSIKNIDEAILSLSNSKKNGDLAIFFL